MNFLIYPNESSFLFCFDDFIIKVLTSISVMYAKPITEQQEG